MMALSFTRVPFDEPLVSLSPGQAWSNAVWGDGGDGVVGNLEAKALGSDTDGADSSSIAADSGNVRAHRFNVESHSAFKISHNSMFSNADGFTFHGLPPATGFYLKENGPSLGLGPVG
jgi:hypothetical protein